METPVISLTGAGLNWGEIEKGVGVTRRMLSTRDAFLIRRVDLWLGVGPASSYTAVSLYFFTDSWECIQGQQKTHKSLEI